MHAGYTETENLTQEEWRPVVGFPGYEVSSHGRVASSRQGARKELRATPNSRGYLRVCLRNDGRSVTRKVHHLVAEAFIGSRPGGQQVRHLDDVKWNNTAANLSYGTRSENARDAVRNGRHHLANRTHCPASHPYDEANTYVSPRGRRVCRACRDGRPALITERAA